jgi:hypothetical protein
MSRRALVVLALGLASAPLLGADAGTETEFRDHTQRCLGIEVSSTPATPRSLARRPQFSSKEILDVNFQVVFPPSRRFAPLDSLELRLYTPHGYLYRRSVVPIQADGTVERRRHLPEQRLPLEVRRARTEARDGRRQRVVAAPPLLVGGTDVMLHSLFGIWRAEAWPRGATRPCGTTFTIVP